MTTTCCTLTHAWGCQTFGLDNSNMLMASHARLPPAATVFLPKHAHMSRQRSQPATINLSSTIFDPRLKPLTSQIRKPAVAPRTPQLFSRPTLRPFSTPFVNPGRPWLPCHCPPWPLSPLPQRLLGPLRPRGCQHWQRFHAWVFTGMFRAPEPLGLAFKESSGLKSLSKRAEQSKSPGIGFRASSPVG